MREQKPSKKRTGSHSVGDGTKPSRTRSPRNKDQKPVEYKDKRISKKDDFRKGKADPKDRSTGKEKEIAPIPLRVNSRGEPARPKSIPGKTSQYLKSKRPEKKEFSSSPPARSKKESGKGESAPKNFRREFGSERKITYGKNTRELPLRNFKREEKPGIKDENPEKIFHTDTEISENNYIYGRHPVMEALKNETAINKVWIGEYTRDTSEIVEYLKDRGIPYKIVPRNKLNDLVGENTTHQGVVAEVSGKEYTELEELIELCKVKSPFFIILDKVEDPHNLGAIIRTADAAGVDGIIIPKHKAVGLTGVVAKTAAGSLERMKVCRVANLNQAMDLLKENNVWTVGVDMDGKDNYSQANFKGSVALVLGGEGQGLGRLLKEKCDFIVKIPMQTHANSLNVSVATAIMIYEVFRQKDFKI